MFNNKKAVEMSMNVIVISIIVVVVLIIVIAFFIGGTSKIAVKISELFSGATAGQDVNLAKQFCTEYCEQGRNTAYCQKTFNVDDDSDPKTKPKLKKCSSESSVQLDPDLDLGISCPAITCTVQ